MHRIEAPVSAADLRITDEVIGMENLGVVISCRIQGAGGGTVSVAFARSALRSHYAPNEQFTVRRLEQTPEPHTKGQANQ